MSAESEYISFNAATGDFMRGGRNLIVNPDGGLPAHRLDLQRSQTESRTCGRLEKFANDKFLGENNQNFFQEISGQFQPGKGTK